MNRRTSCSCQPQFHRCALPVAILVLGLGASSGVAKPAHYLETDLVSDIPGLAAATDPHLVNPWGLTRSATSPWWVSDADAGVSTLYTGAGAINALVVNIPNVPGMDGPGSPTGTVFNGSSDFQVGPNQPARFLFVTEEGTLSGWNPAADPTNAILKVDNSGRAVYKGLTNGQINGANVLYAANFFAGTIDVFDASFNPVTLPAGAFQDRHIGHHFAPFNVQAIGGLIYVTYAQQDEEKLDEVAGPGRGFVDVFSQDGVLQRRMQWGPWLNAPWGVALAPADFGELSGMLLVGQFGSGKIAAFDPTTGRFRGLMRGERGRPVRIEGLWALYFGGGGTSGPTNSLYFTAGIDDEAHGLFGTLTALPDDKKGHHQESRDDDGDDDDSGY